jgi:hypothetical protein
MGTLLSLYDIGGTWDAAVDSSIVARWQPPISVIMNPNPERVARFHALCPQALIELRDQPLSEQHDDMHRDPVATGIRHARELHALRLRVAPGIPAEQVLLPGVNEPDANPAHFNGQAVQHINTYTVARFDEGARLGDRHSGPAFGVTWPFYAQWAPYAPIRAAALGGHHVITCHRYWRADLGLYHEYAQWAGELGDWDDVPIFIEECGDDGLLMNRHNDAPSGWHDVDPAGHVYCQQLFEFDRLLRQQHPNVIGAAPFCYGTSHPWESYNVQPIANQIADHAEQERAQPIVTVFSQRDPRWANEALGTGGGQTIGQSGCLITALASGLVDLGVSTMNPRDLNDWLCQHGGFASGNLLIWSAVAPLGVRLRDFVLCAATPAPIADIRAALASGCIVLAQVDAVPGGTVQQHWVRVLAVDDDGKDARVMDSWQPVRQELSQLSAHYELAGWDVARALFAVAIYERTKN